MPHHVAKETRVFRCDVMNMVIMLDHIVEPFDQKDCHGVGERQAKIHAVRIRQTARGQRDELSHREKSNEEPSPDYSHYEGNSQHCVDRGATLEERRHQRKCFIAFSALGTMLELLAGHLGDNLPRVVFKARCFAFAPEGLRLDRV